GVEYHHWKTSGFWCPCAAGNDLIQPNLVDRFEYDTGSGGAGYDRSEIGGVSPTLDAQTA
ncbi:MAG: hypothetical protein NTV46_10325, partial [Verrucomicrobia bacterium]|nr:hypothetical protein [Verrucomicrobiota bacterium]